MPDSTKPKLLIVAGPNGSGKTTVTHQLLKDYWSEGCEYINPDQIAEESFGGWNSHCAVIKAASHAQDLRYKFLGEHKDIIFETVLSSREKIDYILKAKDEGYFIRLFFIGTDDPTINASRVARRVMENGHNVPIDKIIDRYYRSIANCSLIIHTVDRSYIYDNSRDFESTDDINPELQFRTVDGKLKKQYAKNIHGWAKEILRIETEN